MAALALAALVSCKKDEERLVLQPGGAIALTSNVTNVSLASVDAAK